MDEIAISARDVSKRYHVYDSQRSRLMHALWPAYRGGMQEVWALRGVGFEVRRGESVAVIGRNGGGKSTLLQILTGTLAPTSGEVKVNGRIGALLELGSGFNPEYTGRDNVILNGMLLGLARDEVLRRFGEIAAFAEIGDAMDRPVKTYSSGMMMRLAFAVQVLTDPEILVVDEALSVGDFFFQQKCFSHIRALRERGLTLVFVSHDMGTVRDLCERAVYLKRGEVAFVGDSRTAIRSYLAESPAADSPPGGVRSAAAVAAIRDSAGSIPESVFWRAEKAQAARYLLAVDILGADGLPATQARIGEKIRLRVFFRADEAHAGHVTLVLKNRFDQVVCSVGSYSLGLAPLSSGEAPFAVFVLDVDMMLEAGLYSLMVAFARPIARNQGERLDDTGWIGPLRVQWDYERETPPFLGMFGLPVRASLQAGPSETAP